MHRLVIACALHESAIHPPPPAAPQPLARAASLLRRLTESVACHMGTASEGGGPSLEGAVFLSVRVLLAVLAVVAAALPDAESAERPPQPLLAAPGLPATPAPPARVQ